MRPGLHCRRVWTGVVGDEGGSREHVGYSISRPFPMWPLGPHAFTVSRRTLPDEAGLRRRCLPLRRQASGGETSSPTSSHRVVAIFPACYAAGKVPESLEASVDLGASEAGGWIERFFRRVSRSFRPGPQSPGTVAVFEPAGASTTGQLLAGVTGPARYWEDRERGQRHFAYNKYLGRFHWRHMDLMDWCCRAIRNRAPPHP